jgi:nucleotide-binding universal stress UspA family protein
MKAPELILVPTDMSVYSLAALQYAQVVARMFKASLMLVHVFEPGEPAAVNDASKQAESREDLEKRLRHILSKLLIDNKLVEHSIRIEIRYGSPAHQIVKTAKAVDADLIVMSTHGRTGLRHVMLGSVAEKVVRFSSCPVLTVKPEEFRELVDITKEDIEQSLHLTS